VIVNSNNHYLLQVKGNQPTLFKQVQAHTSNVNSCVDFFKEITHGRGRHEIRNTFVYKNINGISPDRIGLKRLVRVERDVCQKSIHTHETAYFISDIRSNKAAFFARHIRRHWAIENRLHWVKDAIMNEDNSKTTGGMAAENISVMRNIAINLFRLNGHASIKHAIELYAHNFKELLSLINYKSGKCKIT
jgi:predicted transposase YbfD/YdcC